MLLILRPAPEGEHDAKQLSEAGITAYALPMLEIQSTLTDEIMPALAAKIEQATHLIFTSQQAISILSQSTRLNAIYRGKPCFCMGYASAALAQQSKMAPIDTACQTAAELAEAIIAKLDQPSAHRRDAHLLWLSGQQVHYDIQQRLLTAHIQTERDVIYKAVKRASLSDEAIGLIRTGQIRHVLALSARTLEHFQQLLTCYGLWHHHAQMHLIAASHKMAESIDATFAMTHYVDMTAKNRYIHQLIDIINTP